jgi:hypothetical protein
MANKKEPAAVLKLIADAMARKQGTKDKKAKAAKKAATVKQIKLRKAVPPKDGKKGK